MMRIYKSKDGVSWVDVLVAFFRPGTFTKTILRTTTHANLSRRFREKFFLSNKYFYNGEWISLVIMFLLIGVFWFLPSLSLQFGNRTVFIATATLFGLLAVAASSIGVVQQHFKRYDQWVRVMRHKTAFVLAMGVNIISLMLTAFIPVHGVRMVQIVG